MQIAALCDTVDEQFRVFKRLFTDRIEHIVTAMRYAIGVSRTGESLFTCIRAAVSRAAELPKILHNVTGVTYVNFLAPA